MSPDDARPPALVADGVSKRFAIPRDRRHTLKERMLHPLARATYDRLDALRDVSFEVGQGEFFGIVGRNGSGKSTLLKCLAGIYRVDEGRLYVDGRVATFIELGVGFNPEMAARDNVVMNAILLGLSPAEARARFDGIVAFAELDEFVDLKLKNYSSGMHVRLAFSVMVQVDADVLLIDEVLAVGDAAFQQKCFDTFFRLRDEGKTIVFVTHDMAAVERFCHRAMLLERGEIVALGGPREVADRYTDINFARGGAGDPYGGGTADVSDGSARVVEAWMEDEHGARESVFTQGRPCAFRARVRFERPLTDPTFSVAVVNQQQQNVFVATTADRPSGSFSPGEEAVFTVTFDNALAPGRYALSTLISRTGPGDPLVHRYERIFSIVVRGGRPGGGLVDLAHDARVERGAAVAP